MQHDRLSTSGHLDRAIRIAGIGDVGGIGARAEWWLARHELERLAALEAVTDPVGFRSDLPGIRKEPPAGGIGDAMPVKSGHDAHSVGIAIGKPRNSSPTVRPSLTA